MSGQITEIPILTELSELLSKPVRPETAQRARLHLLDWIGCATAGTVEPAGKILSAQSKSGALDKAFIWGGLGNVLEMDDVDKRALLHPGPTIIPAALAVATDEHAILDVLEAITHGYEATIRLGRSVGAGHYAIWHTTGTCGAIGAAVAAASLLNLGASESSHAMALAISQSAGLWHTRHDAASMGKQLHTANAARAGVQSAFLARDGFKGPLRILEGEQGFFAATCPDGDAADVVANPADNWAIHEVSFKPWPACRHAHAVIDAALALKPQIDVENVSEIVVRTYSDALKFCDQPSPQTVIEAKFSLQHAVAIVLLRGEPKLEDFEPAAIEDPRLRVLREKVSVEIGAEFEDVYPARFGAEIICDGVKMRVPDALGDPENPMSEAQIRAKADKLMQVGGIAFDARKAIAESALNEPGNAASLLHQLEEVLS